MVHISLSALGDIQNLLRPPLFPLPLARCHGYSQITADCPELCCGSVRLARKECAEVGKGFLLTVNGDALFSLSREVALCVVPDRIKHERLAEQHLDFVVRPVLCWQRLQEHNDALGESGGRRQT